MGDTEMVDDVESNSDKDARAWQLWSTYARAANLSATSFKIFAFGDSKQLADELLRSVMSGSKRATTSLRRDYVALTKPLPKPGDFAVIVDGNMAPRCIVRIVGVEVKRLRDVDEHFASDDGGGDGSLAWWMSANIRFFTRQGIREGFKVDDDTEVVLERFILVWPLEYANRQLTRT